MLNQLFNSISKKIIIPVVMLMAISGIVIALIAYQLSSSAISLASNKTLTVVSSSLADNLQIWSHNRVSELQNIAGTDTTVKALGKGFLAAGARKAVGKRLSALRTSLPLFQEIGLATADGEYVAVSHENIIPEIRSSSIEAVLRGQLVEYRVGQSQLIIVPVYKKESIAGYIYAKVDISAFASTYFKPKVVGNNVLISLVDATGTTVVGKHGVDFANDKPVIHPVEQFDTDAGISSYVIGAEPYVTGYQKTAGSNEWITVSILETEVFSEVVRAREYSLLFAVATVIASTLILLVLIRAIVRPIHTAKQAFEDLASGQGDLTMRLDVCSNDEISEMALHFNKFANALHDMFLKVRTASHNLAGSTGQISDQSRNNSSTVEKQSVDIDVMAKSISELSSSALQVAELAQQGATTVHEVNDEVENGLKVISDTENSVNELANEIETSEQLVNKLTEASSDINAVVEVINSVAEQTNLLALNAAIEAARAGEMGRGFAVVADEVRVLAQRTQSSAGEIKNTVDVLQSQTQKVRHNFEKSKEDVSATVEKAGAARAVFNTITEAFTKIDSSNAHIASSSREQSAVIDDISKNIIQVTELSEHTSRIAVELLTETDLQEQAISSLNTVVDRFKVGKTEIADAAVVTQKEI